MVLRCFLCIFLLNVFSSRILANDYDDAWKALAHNDRKTASTLLLKAMNDPGYAVDAYITWCYIQSFDSKEDEIEDFLPRFYSKLKDPNAYLYALWFNGSALGSYGKKSGHQLQLLDRMLTDTALNGSMRTAAHYFKAIHYQYSNDFRSAQKEWDKMGAVGPNWQLVGPFDNVSGSGYYKEFGPLLHPEPEAVFTSYNDATVKWFVPSAMCKEGYAFPINHFKRRTAVLYAQSFINSPDDRQVLINVGCVGSIQIYLNDQLVIGSPQQLTTELDYFRQSVHLRKGCNRLLVKLGYTATGSPNFIVRFTNDHFDAVSGLTWSTNYQPYPKETATAKTGTTETPVSIKHFAEAYFEKKVAAEPENLVNYILLTETYLRDDRLMEARKVITAALKKSPDNSILRTLLIQTLIKEANRTLTLEEIERMKSKDPDCLLTIRLKIQQLMEEKKYDEAFKEEERCIALFGEDEESWTTRMTLYSRQEKIAELTKAIQTAYVKYPDNSSIVNWMWSLKTNGLKDAKAGIKILETYLKSNYNYQLQKLLIEEYGKQGEKQKALQQMQNLSNNVPYDPDLITDISTYYYEQAAYDKAADYGRRALALSPYDATSWENLGLELQQQGNDTGAASAFRKALYYNPNKYNAREHLRDLDKKPSLWKAFPETDVYQAVKDASNKTFDHDYFYVLDDKFNIVYPEGAREEYTVNCIKILTQKGIDRWKETNISYNDKTQTLKVEKAEVIKKSGSVVPAEQNENQIVFTGLEVGDAIVLKYKIQNYAEGRISRRFWDSYTFNAFVPELRTRYCLLISNKVKFDYKVVNATITPEQKPYDDYTLYTWQMDAPPVFKSEPFMPPMTDVGPTLHLSTISSWSEIASWYSDLASAHPEDEYEVRQTFDSLFPTGTASLSDREKASRIYHYITGNIHYSSVSFRQGAYIPQKASVTINTRLGDCKDLSSLFASLARMGGLKANLVLVSTRDNGIKTMELPSLEFNHCVVKTWLDGKPYFIELTDNDLPFTSVPYTLEHSQCLVIPSDITKASVKAELEFLESAYRPKERIIRNATVTISGSDMRLSASVNKTGNLVASIRSQFGELSAEKQLEQMQSNVSAGYKNTVKMDSIRFWGLTGAADSSGYKYDMTVQNEVIEVGSMRMIKIPFGDLVASLDNFSKDDRQFPLEYWQYENVDEYETKITVDAPQGTSFTEVPKGETFSFKGSTYSIQFITVSPRRLTIIRKASLQRDNIQPGEYKAMKEFFGKIIKVESKYLAFK